MKKSVIGIALLMFILLSYFAAAETVSSTMRKDFSVEEAADEVVFGDIADLKKMEVDMIVFTAGIIAIIVVLVLIIRQWLKKGSRRISMRKPRTSARRRKTVKRKTVKRKAGRKAGRKVQRKK